MLNYFLVSILSFSGMFFGKILRKLAFEELNQAKKYLVYLQHLLLFTLAVFLIYYSNFSIFLLAFFILGFIFSFFFRKRYFYLGLILAASFFNQSLLILSSSLIFIYGLSFSFLSKGIWTNLLYFIIGIILAFIFPNNYLIYFAAGSIFLRY